MKKFTSGAIFMVTILSILRGCSENTFNRNKIMSQVEEAKETMGTSVFVDPSIDQSSNKTVSIIIEFKTKPAKIAVIEAEAQGKQLSLDEAKQKVEESHEQFQKELQTLLAQNQVPFTVKHVYKTALNGVSMELPGNEVKRLMQSSVIGRITLNKEIHLDPPIQPFKQM
ncbi:protease inhibitor I9 family protein [Bacillus sp. EAC]|uniref:protease inhibitor I9 family protein n=1 Tax=Bacillus sp. EAC TaxID=1978338 RepID=UPI00211AE21F|nr:protease inhibitor I9 family protein [Bacillus sp. EAC]